MGYEYKIYYFPRVNMFHEFIGVYGKCLAPSGASFTYYVGETLGI